MIETERLRLEGRLLEADRSKGEWITLRVYALPAREHARRR